PDSATTQISPRSLHDALPISLPFLDDGGICTTDGQICAQLYEAAYRLCEEQHADVLDLRHRSRNDLDLPVQGSKVILSLTLAAQDRKSTRLNSSHQIISYAVF